MTSKGLCDRKQPAFAHASTEKGIYWLDHATVAEDGEYRNELHM